MNSNESSSFFTSASPVLLQAMPMKHIEGSTNGICDLFTIEKDGKLRVLKCLEAKYRGNPVYEALLRKEYEIGYSLSCPYICEVYSFLEHPVLGWCIEMEWIDGVPLEKYLKTVLPTTERKLRLLNQLFDAVSYFHSKQVIHKDLKPANILVTHNGANIKIIDFGFADKDVYRILKLSAGTEKYAAPELKDGKPVDNRADIWSLGKLLLLFGGRWRSVARKCLRINPARRYGSVEELRRAVNADRRGWRWLLSVILLAGAVLVFILLRQNSPVPEQNMAEDNVPVVAEEQVSEPVTTPASTILPVNQTATEPSIESAPDNTVSSEVDRIVKEATGLFQQESH